MVLLDMIRRPEESVWLCPLALHEWTANQPVGVTMYVSHQKACFPMKTLPDNAMEIFSRHSSYRAPRYSKFIGTFSSIRMDKLALAPKALEHTLRWEIERRLGFQFSHYIQIRLDDVHHRWFKC